MSLIKEVVFISPMYNAKPHLKDLIESLKEQSNPNWRHIIIDDMSTDSSYEYAIEVSKDDSRIEVRKNKEKHWALKNVIKVAREFQERSDVVVAIIDADDALCNENTVDLLIKTYDDKTDTVWTAHSWDINSMNISKSLPENINPYQFPWVSSHLKTWRGSLLKGISDNNFKNLDEKWFQRGYDQALYLPLLYKSRKRLFIDEICYLYRINPESKKYEKQKQINIYQMNTSRQVRAQGFID